MFYYSILFNLSASLLPFFTLNLNVLKLQAVILPNRWIVGLTGHWCHSWPVKTTGYIKLLIGNRAGRTESTLLHQKFAHVQWYCLPPYVSFPSLCLDESCEPLSTFKRQIPQAERPSSLTETWWVEKSKLLLGGYHYRKQVKHC